VNTHILELLRLAMATSNDARLQQKSCAHRSLGGSSSSFRRCYGSEFTSNAILHWADRTKVEWHYIAPGKPIQDAFIESFKVLLRPMHDQRF